MHGDQHQTAQLKQSLDRVYADGSVRVLAPQNAQQLSIGVRAQKLAKVVGRLASAYDAPTPASLPVALLLMLFRVACGRARVAALACPFDLTRIARYLFLPLLEHSRTLPRPRSEPAELMELSGVLVRKDYSYTLMAAEDLATFTRLAATSVRQKLTVSCGVLSFSARVPVGALCAWSR